MWAGDVWEGWETAGRSERDWLGAPRRQLGRAVELERASGVAVAWGRSGVPGVRPDGIPPRFKLRPPWSLEEAHLVWCDHVFGRPGAVELVAALREAVRPGTLVAVVDVDEVASAFVRTWLSDTLGLAPAVGVRSVLPKLFRPLAATVLHQRPGWTSFTFVGER